MSSYTARMATSTGLILYYHPYSFYSQKVVLALKEKKLSYESNIIDIIAGDQYSPSFLKLNPRGEVPVLEDNGKIIPDSARIIDYLEDNFSNGHARLTPMSNMEVKTKVERFRQMIDQLPAGIITIGSFFHTDLVKEPKMPFILPVRIMLKNAEMTSSENLRKIAELNPDARNVLIKKAEFQEIKHGLIVDRDEYVKILRTVDNVLENVNNELMSHEDQQWLCSDEFSLADVGLIILLVRLDALGFSDYFWANGKRSYIEKYYKRAEPKIREATPGLSYHIEAFVNSKISKQLGLGFCIGAATLIALIIKRYI